MSALFITDYKPPLRNRDFVFSSMDELPATGFTVYNLVHKLAGGSGGPTRVIAVIGRGAASASDPTKEFLSHKLILMFTVALMWINLNCVY